VLDEMIDQFDFEDSPEGISPFLDEIFAGVSFGFMFMDQPRGNFSQYLK
jgi:hypothetical protein